MLGVAAMLAATAALAAPGGVSVSRPAHDLDYAVATVDFEADGTFEIAVSFHIAAYVLEARAAHLPIAVWSELRSMGADELERRVARARNAFISRLRVFVDGGEIRVDEVTFPRHASIRDDGLAAERRRAPPVVIRGRVPDGGRELAIAFPYQMGVTLLDVARPGTNQFVPPGRKSLPVPVRAASAEVITRGPSAIRSGIRYMGLGFQHILPRGLDHILFVLALFFLSTRITPLVWQVTAFTVAHSMTLTLATFGVVALPASVVEPLIAASIAFVALENLATSRLRPWRPMVVFLFGLVHGLGFATVLTELGLPPAGRVLSLATFNLGVELGQLGIVCLAFLLMGRFWQRRWYRGLVSVPASVLIASVGVFWTLDRAGVLG